MRPIHRAVLLTLSAATLLATSFVLVERAARASGTACSAHMAGLETSRKTPVEVVAFNGSGVGVTLDLRLLDAAGDVVLDRPGAIVVAPFGTAIVSLEQELSRDLAPKQRPFEGIVAVELVGAAPFADDTVIVHATQYFGKRKKPRGAVVFRPLFREVP